MKNTRQIIENLTDGEFIDLWDNILGITENLTATEKMIQLYKTDERVRELINKNY